MKSEKREGPRPTKMPWRYPDGWTYEPVDYVLANWRPGSQDWTWGEEFESILHDDNTSATLRSVIESGFQDPSGEEPIILGTDGRVWSGHHRLLVALLTRQFQIPVVIHFEGIAC